MPYAAANRSNVVLSGNFRISVITERLIRFEWSADRFFEDRMTLAVVNRDLGERKFSLRRDGARLTVDTGMVKIVLRDDGGKFSEENLSVSFDLGGRSVCWHPGMPDTGNLGGTCRTLDNFDADVHCETGAAPEIGKGFISRDGWSLIDDSRNILLDDGPFCGVWAAPRPAGERQDCYLLAYGHDYAAALRDAAEVFGRQPLPPRYALGYWYSRYWAYSDSELSALTDDFDAAGIPIDVMILDMDWHLPGWTGTTWDRRYFPEPASFLDEMHRRGLHVGLNLHPADGVGAHEEQFPAMAAAMGADASSCARIPFDVADPAYMKHYFSLLLHPHEEIGVDFWWMDWQQGKTSAVEGLDPLPWLNLLHWLDMAACHPEKRPLIFSRFGGIGAGRYPIGFSGDTISTFRSLAYQIGFTAQSANVLYGCWSHDLGGHMLGDFTDELYLRWLQFGMLSPIMRTHGGKYSADRAFFARAYPYPKLLGETVRRRYELIPYIYTAYRRSFDTGISLCHPLYYRYPECEEAYRFRDEYFFGEDFIAAPVVTPREGETSERRFFLPEGRWYDTATGIFYDGGIHSARYLLEEVPLFARAGAVVPGQKGVRRLNGRSIPNLLLTVYPGADGSGELYDDDGSSEKYRREEGVRLDLRHRKEGRCRIVDIRPRAGSARFGEKKELFLRFPGVIPPEKVLIDGEEAPWRYCGEQAELEVIAGETDLDHPREVRVCYPEEDEFAPMTACRGLFARLRIVAGYHNKLGGDEFEAVDTRLGQDLGHIGRRLTLHPERWRAEMAYLREKLPSLKEEIIKTAHCLRWETDDAQERMAMSRPAFDLIDDFMTWFPVTAG